MKLRSIEVRGALSHSALFDPPARLKRRNVVIAMSMLLVACSKREETSTSPSPSPPPPPEPPPTAFELGLNVAAFLIDHPIFKILAFLRIVMGIGKLIAHYNEQSKTVEFNTLNPLVAGSIHAESFYVRDSFATFKTPDGKIAFDADQFLKANSLNTDNYAEVEALDSQLEREYSACSDQVEKGSETVLFEKLKLRIACMGENVHAAKMDYFNIKLRDYAKEATQI